MSDDVTGYGGTNPPVSAAQPTTPDASSPAPAGSPAPDAAVPLGSFAPEPTTSAPVGSFLPEPLPASSAGPVDPEPSSTPPGGSYLPAHSSDPWSAAPGAPVAPAAGAAPSSPQQNRFGTPIPPDAAGTEPGVGLTELEILPAHAAPTSRRPGRTAVIATLAVLALLVVGGGAYGVSLLHRPDVQLARAFDATKSQPSGGMTVSLRVSGAAATPGTEMLTNSSVHYAWGPDTQQFTVTLQGKPMADVVTTPTHLTLQLALADVPGTAAARRQLHTMATTMGAEGQALADLADGKPIGLAYGPGSDIQKLIDKARAQQSSASSQAVGDQAAAIADSLSKVVRDNTTVTQTGSDANGDRFTASIPLAPLVTELQGELAKAYPGMSPLSSKDLAQIQGKVLTADVWVKDGRVSRLEIPLAALADAPKGGEATVVVVMDTNGVTPPAGPVTEVPSSLLQSLLDPMSGCPRG